MSISKYRAFIQVVEAGSLTKAAVQLGYSQPGVSHMIDSLESEMGFPLLVRNKDRIVPTENGKKILGYCYQIIKKEEELQETVTSINGIMEGDIKLGALRSLMGGFIPRAVSAFSSAYSRIHFHLYELEQGAFDEKLVNGVIDIGFMGEEVPKGYTFIPLLKDRARVIMREDHPLASYEKLSTSLLNGCDFIMPMPGFDDVIASIQQESPFNPNVKYYPASDTCAIAMVANNLGISVISSLQEGQLPQHVISRELDGDYGRNLGICIKSAKHASPAVKEFVRIARKAAAEMSGVEHIA